jgi:hypothetical protein
MILPGSLIGSDFGIKASQSGFLDYLRSRLRALYFSSDFASLCEHGQAATFDWLLYQIVSLLYHLFTSFHDQNVI